MDENRRNDAAIMHKGSMCIIGNLLARDRSQMLHRMSVVRGIQVLLYASIVISITYGMTFAVFSKTEFQKHILPVMSIKLGRMVRYLRTMTMITDQAPHTTGAGPSCGVSD